MSNLSSYLEVLGREGRVDPHRRRFVAHPAGGAEIRLQVAESRHQGEDNEAGKLASRNTIFLQYMRHKWSPRPDPHSRYFHYFEISFVLLNFEKSDVRTDDVCEYSDITIYRSVGRPSGSKIWLHWIVFFNLTTSSWIERVFYFTSKYFYLMTFM